MPNASEQAPAKQPTSSSPLTPRVRLQAERTRRGISVDEMAELCGVRPKTYKDWETGRAAPRHEAAMFQIAQRLDAPVEALFADVLGEDVVRELAELRRNGHLTADDD